jgi:hypothetical protein
MSEESARKMLMNKLYGVYAMGQGDGLSGGMGYGLSGGVSRARKAGAKRGAKKNKWIQCLPRLRKAHPGMKLKQLRHYYKDDGPFNACELGKAKRGRPRKRAVGAGRKKPGRPRAVGRPRKHRKGGELVDNYNFYNGGELIEGEMGHMYGGRNRMMKHENRLPISLQKCISQARQNAKKGAGRHRRARGGASDWINKVKHYQMQHGVSYKQALMDLKGTQ